MSNIQHSLFGEDEDRQLMPKQLKLPPQPTLFSLFQGYTFAEKLNREAILPTTPDALQWRDQRTAAEVAEDQQRAQADAHLLKF